MAFFFYIESNKIWLLFYNFCLNEMKHSKLDEKQIEFIDNKRIHNERLRVDQIENERKKEKLQMSVNKRTIVMIKYELIN